MLLLCAAAEINDNEGMSEMTQIMFPLDQAHEAIDRFLSETEGLHPDKFRTGRWIAGEDGEPVAHIVTAEEYDNLSNGHHHWLAAQEVREEGIGQSADYLPWTHSPLATTDRLLPTEPLMGPLAHALYRKPLGELEQGERDRVLGLAIVCLLRVQLDPDGQGAVPVMVAGHDNDEPGGCLRWQMAFRTGVAGLYVRVTANGFFGEEWGIVTGSGYRLAGGWYDREEAGACVAELGRVLPNTDWMRLTPNAFTPRAKEAIGKVVARHRSLGSGQEKPEPEVMADEVPPAADGVAGQAEAVAS